VLAERRELRASRMSELLDTLPADDREVILGALPALKLLASLDQADERSLSQ
jgi:hypothetical protein